MMGFSRLKKTPFVANFDSFPGMLCVLWLTPPPQIVEQVPSDQVPSVVECLLRHSFY